MAAIHRLPSRVASYETSIARYPIQPSTKPSGIHEKLIQSACINVLLLASTVVAAGTVEGKVNFALTSGKDKPMAMNYSVKGDKLRIDMPDQKDMGGMMKGLVPGCGK